MSWLRLLWDAMWPNMFAPSAITLAAVAISHVRHRKHAETQHEALKDHLDKQLKAHLTGVAVPPPARKAPGPVRGGERL